jgi:hypothetical protein
MGRARVPNEVIREAQRLELLYTTWRKFFPFGLPTTRELKLLQELEAKTPSMSVGDLLLSLYELTKPKTHKVRKPPAVATNSKCTN